jgi:Uma2 family endonuclease
MHDMLYDLPEIEYLSGQPYPKVSPKRVHAIVQGNVCFVLRRSSRGRGQAGTEWRFKLSIETEFVPDVAFVSYERLRTLSDVEADEPPLAPDIAVEIRSPSNRANYNAQKFTTYLRYGAVLVLDVDPKERVVHAHAVDGSLRTYRAGEAFAHDAVPWLQFHVDELFEDIEIPR